MATKINPAALAYINGKIEESPETAEDVRVAMYNLKMLDESAFNFTVKIIYSFQLPIDVSFLMFDLVLTQVKFGDKPNVQKAIGSLTRNEKTQYSCVYPHYKRLIDEYEEKKQKALNPTSDDDEYTYYRNKRPATFFKANAEYYIINPARIPKQGWLINVYAESYNEYCEIVTKTIKEMKEKQSTIFLKIPEVFEKQILKSSPQIAFSIFANEFFSFTNLSEEVLSILDSGENLKLPPKEIVIGGRTTLSLKLFDSKKYLFNKLLTLDNKNLINAYSDADKVFYFIEELGNKSSMIEYYTETMTGLPASENSPYKPIIFYSEDIEEVNDVLDELDEDNVDFIVEADHKEIKILFIHVSHYDKIINELSEYEGLEIIENPKL